MPKHLSGSTRMVALVVLAVLLVPTFAVASSHLDAQVADHEERLAALEAEVFGTQPEPEPEPDPEPEPEPEPEPDPEPEPEPEPEPHPGTHPEPDADGPPTCEGYPEPRVFLESQVWWQPSEVFGGEEDNGHVHVGTCWPRRTLPNGDINTISGDLELDVKITVHDNEHPLRELSYGFPGGETTRVFFDDRVCDQATCSYWEKVTLDTAAHPYDGWREFRISAKQRILLEGSTRFDEMFQSTTWQVNLDNGKPVNDHTTRTIIEGRGWYTGAEYITARMEDDLPYTVSGVWSPRVTTRPGSGGVDVEWSFVSVDPNFHQDDEGVVLLDRAGRFDGRVDIDTTELEDGWHRLFIRADAPCDGSSGNDCGRKADGTSNNVATTSGIQVIWFLVDNG